MFFLAVAFLWILAFTGRNECIKGGEFSFSIVWNMCQYKTLEKQRIFTKQYLENNNTAWRMSVFRVFWSLFSHIRTEYGEIRSISLYSVLIRENTDQKNSEYGQFSCSANEERNRQNLRVKECPYSSIFYKMLLKEEKVSSITTFTI